MAGFTSVVTCARSGFMARVWELVLMMFITLVLLSAGVVAKTFPGRNLKSFTASVRRRMTNQSMISVFI